MLRFGPSVRIATATNWNKSSGGSLRWLWGYNVEEEAGGAEILVSTTG